MSYWVQFSGVTPHNLCSEEPLLLKQSVVVFVLRGIWCFVFLKRLVVWSFSNAYKVLAWISGIVCRFSVLAYAPKSLGCSNLMKGLIPSIWVKHLRCVDEFFFSEGYLLLPSSEMFSSSVFLKFLQSVGFSFWDSFLCLVALRRALVVWTFWKA